MTFVRIYSIRIVFTDPENGQKYVPHLYIRMSYIYHMTDFTKMAAILDFSLHSIQHRGENRGKLIFMKGRYLSVICEKISFLHFFSKSKCIALGLQGKVPFTIRAPLNIIVEYVRDTFADEETLGCALWFRSSFQKNEERKGVGEP